ncbi:hypothetical protein HDU99_008488, partial [Rhizoclosmatium hyalinum]
MTGISVARQLNLCKQVLLIDVFDGVVGFRRLKQDLLNPETINQFHGEQLHHASSIDSLVSISATPKKKKVAVSQKVPAASSTEFAKTEEEETISSLPRNNTFTHLGDAVPQIRVRAATGTKSQKQNHEPQQVRESYRVYPLDQLAKTQNDMGPNTELALTGPALELMIATREGWKENLVGEKFLDWVVLKGVVFARMKPDQKTWIVERLIKMG